MGKAQINLRVDEEQKNEWEEFVEESRRYSTLSELIRASVESEIEGEPTESAVESPAMSTDLVDLKDQVERIRKDVRFLREQEQDAVDISEVAQDVMGTLRELPNTPVTTIPDEVDDPKSFKQREAAHQVIRPASENDSRSPQTARAIAERVGFEKEEVKDAIEHLQDQYIPVIEAEIDGNTHYFMEG